LKRLADAERDGDNIYAVIRGIGGSSDGKGKGITAPNPVGQVLAVQRAWHDAGPDPATATLVEAHGTSTRVGDVTEVESLSKVFASAERGRIALGSAKSNIGHLKAGAGAAGLLKTVMALHDKVLPPTLNSEKPNPNINFAALPFRLNHEAREWERPSGFPRRAGVSAYGFGGTNFHVVLEEYVPGMLKAEERKQFAGATTDDRRPTTSASTSTAPSSVVSGPSSAAKPPIRGILALGTDTPVALKDALDAAFRKVEGGWTPPIAAPEPATLRAPERLVIDFGTHDELLAALPGTAIFHFAGHGVFTRQMADQPGTYTGTGALAFYDQSVDAEQLGINLRGQSVRLAVLGGCETGRRDGVNVWSGVAPALVKQQIPAVIANQLPIKDACAIAFSKQLYGALAGGLPIEQALAAGRVAAYNADKEGRDWGVPVLYMRDADGVLFAATGAGAQAAAAAHAV
ncbi:hypothetical protein SE17_32420, partial [Kouleothrix aurantiaca]